MSKFPYKLKDLIDIESTAQMFELLYEVAQIPNAVIDMEGNVLVGAGWQSICTDFHRKNPESAALCVESDTHISEEIAAGKPHCIYECPLGLVDSSSPIIIDGHHLGNVFTGQMLHTPLTDDTRDRFRAQAKQYGYNEEEYLKALEQVPVFPIEKHKEILQLLANIAEQLAHSGLDRLRVIEQSKKLEESEERYNLATAATKDGIYDWNLVTNEIYYSPTWKSMLGYEEHELPNDFSVWEKLTKPDDVKASWKMQQEVINKQHDRFQMEFQMLHKDGHWVDILSRAEAVFDDTGKAIRMVGTHIDISERKQAEELLLQERKQAQQYLDVAGVMFVALDENGSITLINQKGCDILGYTEAEILHKNWFDFCIAENEREEVWGVFKQLLSGKMDPVEYFENAVVTKTGEHKIIAFHNSFITDKESNITGTLGSGEDITARKQAEEDLRNSELRYRSLIDATASIIWTADATGGYVSPQPSWEKFTGQPWSEAKGYGWGKKIHPDDTERILAVWEKAVKELSIYETWGHVWNEELKEWRDFEVTAVPVLGLDGSLHEWVGIMTDITERKQAEVERLALEARFHQSQKLEAVGTMVGGIAHEFNNILQSIFLYGGILKGQLQDDENTKTSLKAIIDSSDRGAKIVAQIMTFSRESETNMQSHDLKILLGEAIELERALLPSQIEIVEEFSGDYRQIRCDSTQMQQIVVNLCNNAKHAMPKGGTLTVGLKEILPSHKDNDHEQTLLELSISDTGMGMNKEILDKIFDPFFTTKEVGKGTGLGLSVVHGLVEQMGGTITATSKLGKGSTFRILIPAVDV